MALTALNITYRPATEEDREWLWELRCESIRGYVEALWGWDESYQFEQFRLSFEEDPWQIILLKENPVGALVVLNQGDHIYLANLYIVSRQRRRGIGRRVMKATQNEARSK